MTYIDHVFACMAAPLLVAALCTHGRVRSVLIFCIAGMGTCLFSAYISTFFESLYGADPVATAVEISPVVEEILKLLPLLFYLLVYEPEPRELQGSFVAVAAGFATFENTCYLVEFGADQLSELLLRGFGTGAMHIVCGGMVGYGLMYVWQHRWLKLAGTFGLLCAAITFHAVFNLLLSAGGAVRTTGYVLPLLSMLLGISVVRLYRERRRNER